MPIVEAEVVAWVVDVGVNEKEVVGVLVSVSVLVCMIVTVFNELVRTPVNTPRFGIERSAQRRRCIKRGLS